MILVTMKEGHQRAETGIGRRKGTGIEIKIVRGKGIETGTGKGIGTGTVIVITEITETGKEVREGNVTAAEMMIPSSTVAETVIGEDTAISFQSCSFSL